MISLLVPVYNTDVRRLAASLSLQSANLQTPVEIILLDDGSDAATLKINDEITANTFVKYFLNGQNTGRINTRNKLASLATHEWLIFLDADSRIENDSFIENYKSSIADEKTILVGGRTYDTSRPLLCKYMLHWKYGSERESRWRSTGNSRGFQSNNFMMHRSIFKKMRFPAEMTAYGHEDTWMGIQAEDLQCIVKHINNAVVHLGLQTSEQFIHKSAMALQNLLLLSEVGDRKKLSEHVRLYRSYLHIKNIRMTLIIKFLYKILQKKIFKNLHSCNPNLHLYDLYRLNYFITISR